MTAAATSAPRGAGWMLDEVASAGRENLDAEHVSRYDDKEDAGAATEVELLRTLGLDQDSVVVDLGAAESGLKPEGQGPTPRVVDRSAAAPVASVGGTQTRLVSRSATSRSMRVRVSSVSRTVSDLCCTGFEEVSAVGKAKSSKPSKSQLSKAGKTLAKDSSSKTQKSNAGSTLGKG